ncbi:MAG: family 10 glycosylhydrolase [Haliscomenobacter sp.]|uniref:glycoside hydrolase family 10 protein n=1 Tax=Haliscomenobacter sp. TaxID=2717303 RepID=UPI0029AE3A0F|nr:family 10 glycosylhydrolase [Haliscomenobacter sp.]MDX2072721.1 family 10 glycosylhydrolase [Haliscomenobacter sp.]
MRYFILFLCCFFSYSLQAQAPHGAIRGIWVTAQDSVLDSKTNIQKAVENCKKAGINNIYVSTWNRGRTLYPSAIMMERFGVAIDPRFGKRDPLKELVEAAHAEKIKVHAWFEYGFASAQGDSGAYLLKKYPYYAAIGPDGKGIEKNGLTWMNAFHPLVQNFVKSLVLEVVKRYDLDGIQGDNRLTAAPSLAGYDAYTLAEYKKEHGRLAPPINHLDSNWIQWRAHRLNKFGKDLYQSVKAAKPNVLVSMAPNVYPSSLQEYLQDWPSWLREGYVDYVVVQLYSYKLDEYEKILKETIQQVGSKKGQLYAGVLIGLEDGYRAKPELLKGMLELNQKYDLPGELFFYHAALPKSGKMLKR